MFCIFPLSPSLNSKINITPLNLDNQSRASTIYNLRKLLDKLVQMSKSLLNVQATLVFASYSNRKAVVDAGTLISSSCISSASSMEDILHFLSLAFRVIVNFRLLVVMRPRTIAERRSTIFVLAYEVGYPEKA